MLVQEFDHRQLRVGLVSVYKYVHSLGNVVHSLFIESVFDIHRVFLITINVT